MTPKQFAAIEADIKARSRKVSFGTGALQDDLQRAKARNAQRLKSSPGARGARGVAPGAPKAQERGKRVPELAPEPSEDQIQAAVVAWWAIYCKTKGLDERLLVAVPNGSHLAGDARARAIQMRRLKATGFRPGYPDLILDLPTGVFHGMRIELKAKTGRTSPDQAAYIHLLRRQNYNVLVCWSVDEAVRAIVAYCERGL